MNYSLTDQAHVPLIHPVAWPLQCRQMNALVENSNWSRIKIVSCATAPPQVKAFRLSSHVNSELDWLGVLFFFLLEPTINAFT